MFKNYLKIGLRNLWNKRIYSGINLLGLSIAAAFCLLVYMYIKQERSFDRFHANSDRLYRLEASSLFNFDKEEKDKGLLSSLLGGGDDTRYMLTHPYVLPDDIKNNFPEVEAVVRSQGAGDPVVWYNGEAYKMKEDATSYVERNFFSVLDFPLLYGNPATVLSDPKNVVINERTAIRLFGRENPVGKIIEIRSQERSFVVSGVAKDFPANSSMDYDMLFPLEAHPSHLENSADRSNNHFNYTALLLLKPKVDAAVFEKKLAAFSQNYFADMINAARKVKDQQSFQFRLYIRPLAEAHYNPSTPWAHYTNLENIYQLAVLSILILIIACVNYILLSLTNTVSRSQEVGVRKTVGARRKHIVFQFLTETQLLVLIAIATGGLISFLSLPLFNSLTGANITLSLFSVKDIVMAGIVLFVFLGVAAGVYPAFVMSGMRPLNLLQKFSSVKISPVLSRGLVVVQYTACILLIVCSLVIAQQMKYMNKMQLGFDKELVVTTENPYEWRTPERLALPQRLYQYAASDPAIANVTSADTRFGAGANRNGHLINDQRELISQIPVDYGYFDFLGIQLVKGRFFSRDIASDSMRLEIPEEMRMQGSSSTRRAIVVNETLYKMLGQPPLDEINRPMGGRIIGVCKDYQFANATEKIPPAYHMIGGNAGFAYTYFKIKPQQDIAVVLDRLRSNWSQLTAKQPFSFSFLDEEVKRSYESYTQWLRIINIATLLAVIIAGMGLFGLSALYALNKTKEVGIRKVMGASVTDIFLLLNKDAVRLSLIAFVIAIPPGIYFMNNWLQHFAYRIQLSWVVFALAGLAGLLLAIVAVGYHSIRAAVANPVKSLRTE